MALNAKKLIFAVSALQYAVDQGTNERLNTSETGLGALLENYQDFGNEKVPEDVEFDPLAVLVEAIESSGLPPYQSPQAYIDALLKDNVDQAG